MIDVFIVQNVLSFSCKYDIMFCLSKQVPIICIIIYTYVDLNAYN